MVKEELARVSVRVFGDVHGVGFRYSTWMEAQRREIVGWVRNEPDGSVFIVAEGEKRTLEEFVAWCKMGPRWVKVEKVEAEWGKATGEFDTFTTH